VFVTPKEAATLSGLSEMRVRKLIASGELPSMLDGRSRRVFAVAVYDRMIAKTKASNPPAGPKLKANPFFGVRPQEKRDPMTTIDRLMDVIIYSSVTLLLALSVITATLTVIWCR
jgi:excisionase family DNA binding protein